MDHPEQQHPDDDSVERELAEFGRAARQAQDAATDREWARLRARIVASESSHGGRAAGVRIGLAAAAVLACALVGLGVWRSRRALTPDHRATLAAEMQSVTTKPGERITLHFPDSTVIQVGPATTLRYRLSAARREVELDGFAAFSVKHDSARPFVVHAGALDVEDIGTQFVVRAYADSLPRVTVTEGEVRAHLGAAGDVALVHAGESIDVRDGAQMALTIVDSSVRAAAQDRLAFHNASLRDVAATLQRWFGVDVRIADSVAAKRRVTAVYSSGSLDAILRSLEAADGLTARRDGRAVVLSATQ